ncbi:uncharacterized protein LOC135095250 isoform X2 [Scylla paramamosain]
MASNPHHLVKEFLEAIQHHPTAAAHRKNEQEKIRAYGERIQHVDQGSFTPLVFTTSGGMGSKAQCFYSRLADLMAEKEAPAKEPCRRMDEVPSLILPPQICPPVSQGDKAFHSHTCRLRRPRLRGYSGGEWHKSR